MAYKYVYLPYVLSRKVNYIYLLCLYSIAEKCDDSKIKTDIDFTSFDYLENQINTKLKKYQQRDKDGTLKTMVSASTLSRIVKKEEYKPFFHYGKFGANKLITLNNDFSKTTQGKKYSSPFVRLSPAMVQLLLETQDNLLAQYIIYLVHFCGVSQNQTDFTAKQFLQACGYATNSNNYLSKISEYNNLLQKKGIIKIKSWRDENGMQRNTYSLINYAEAPNKIVLGTKPEGIEPQSDFIF